MSGTKSKPIIIPEPYEIIYNQGCFKLNNNQTISYDASVPEIKDVISYFINEISIPTGFSFLTTEIVNSGDIQISKSSETLGEEEYLLNITNDKVSIIISNKKGLFYAFQTFLQLFDPSIYRSQLVQNINWEVQCVTIHDKPRFQWRGVMIDSSRHFFDVNAIKRTLDAMAINKLNTFHFHITDDQGWRFESKKYPRLHEYGSIRKESPKKWNRLEYDNEQYGPYYYTQEELIDLVKYADQLMITIVPEFDIPGHCAALMAAYPEHACSGCKYEVSTNWGGSDPVCVGNDDTIQFIKNILEEMLQIFPSKIIHCGGDEVPFDNWKKCPKCQQRLKDINGKTESNLQTWFMNEISKFVESKGREIIGWDEIIDEEISQSVNVMSWRGTSGGIVATKSGHKVVMSPTTYSYIDYGQYPYQDDSQYMPRSFIPLSRVYSFNPCDGVAEDRHNLIIGVQANMWSEYIYHGPDELDYKVWPREIAIAEVSWTQDHKKDINRFINGLATIHLSRLKEIGLNFGPIGQKEQLTWSIGSNSQVQKEWSLCKLNDHNERVNYCGKYCVAFVLKEGSVTKVSNPVITLEGNQFAANIEEVSLSEDDSNHNIFTFNLEYKKECQPTLTATISGGPSQGEVIFYFLEK